MGDRNCPICNKTFTLKIHLVVHLRTVHNSPVNGKNAMTLLPKNPLITVKTASHLARTTASSSSSPPPSSSNSSTDNGSESHDQGTTTASAALHEQASKPGRVVGLNGTMGAGPVSKYKLSSPSRPSDAGVISRSQEVPKQHSVVEEVAGTNNCEEVDTVTGSSAGSGNEAKGMNDAGSDAERQRLLTGSGSDGLVNVESNGDSGDKDSPGSAIVGVGNVVIITSPKSVQKRTNEVGNSEEETVPKIVIRKDVIRTRKTGEVPQKSGSERINKVWGFAYSRSSTPGLPDRWTCVVCNKGMNTFGSLALHLRKNHGSMQRVAIIDGGSKNLGPLVHSPLLVRRERRSCLKPWSCKKCGKNFMRHKDMWKHRINFCGLGQKYKCPCCPAEFKQKFLLYEHRMVHNFRGQLKLKVCKPIDRRGESYSEDESLIFRRNSETFSSQSSSSGDIGLSRNFLRGDNPAPPVATTTGVNAGSSNNSEISTSEFKCRFPGCGKVLPSAHQLSEHARLVHKLFPCLECESVLESRLALDHHYLKRHHKPMAPAKFNATQPPTAVNGRSRMNLPLLRQIKVEPLTHEPAENEQTVLSIPSSTSVPGKAALIVSQNHAKPTTVTTSKAMRAVYCPICNVRYPNVREYLEHQKLHKDPKKIKQEAISNSASSAKVPAAAGQGIAEKGAIRIKSAAWTMRIRGLVAGENSNDQILRIKTEDKGVGDYKCEDCGQDFRTSKTYQFHVSRGLCKKMERPYKCNDCDQGFTREASLKNHVKSVHEPPSPEENVDEEPMEEDDDDVAVPSPRKKQCPVCGKVFQTLRNLNTHVALYHTERIPNAKNDRLKFIMERHKKPLPVTQSRPLMAPPKTRPPLMLKARPVSRSPSPPLLDYAGDYLCNECGKNFNGKKDLAEHLLWHNAIKNSRQFNRGPSRNPSFSQASDDEFLHTCAVCGGGFRRRGEMLVHVRYAHSRKGIYGCIECERVFQDAIALIEHQGVHKKIPKGERLSRPGERSHGGPEETVLCFPCIYCGSKFPTLPLLHEHRKRMHPAEKSLICPFPNCCIPYVHEMGLKRHMRDHEL